MASSSMMTAASPAATLADELFAAERDRLIGLAYRLLGTRSEAEDVVQDVYLAWRRAAGAEAAGIARPRDYLTRMTARKAVDELRSARRRRQHYYGLWLPEPAAADQDDEPVAGSDVPMALLLLLERLSPVQRAVYVLRTALALDHDAIAATLGRSPAAVRQAWRRAQQRLAAAEAQEPAMYRRESVDPQQFQAFVSALASGDSDRVAALLADDATLLADGGGHVAAALNPIRSADHVARLLVGLQRKFPGRTDARAVTAHGGPALALYLDGRPAGLLVPAGRPAIRSLYQIVNPEKVPALPSPAGLSTTRSDR